MSNQICRYVPSGFQLLREVPDLGIQVYGQTEPRVAAIFYGGKRTKSDWYYSFRSVDAMNARIDDTINGIQQSKAAVAKRRAERAAPTDVAVGDVFRCSWGYDQTNIDYFQVIEVSGVYVTVREIGQMAEETGFLCGDCVPAVNQFRGEPMRKKIQNCGGEPAFKVYSFASAYRMKPVTKVANVPVFESSRWSAYA